MPKQPPICKECGDTYDERRALLGYGTCLNCGSPNPVRCVAPAYNKGGLQLITNPKDLRQIHKKGDEL